jgi:hypothetical protein
MLDTVRGKITSTWVKDIHEKQPLGWKIKKGTMEGKDGQTLEIMSCVHEESGMYVKGDYHLSHICQVSLPRLYHGDNTELLKNEDELNVALDKMKLKLLDVIEFTRLPQWTRLDLVWNHKGRIEDFITALSCSKHPKVRSSVRIYKGESITWAGKKITIQVYDKLKEKGSIKPVNKDGETIVRSEVRNYVSRSNTGDEKKDLIAMLCTPEMGGMRPVFEKCYKYYREIMVQLSPKEIPELATRSPIDFIAYLHANNLRDNQGMDLADLYLSGKSRASKYRIQRELKARILRYKFISYRQLLPENNTPPSIGRSDIKYA